MENWICLLIVSLIIIKLDVDVKNIDDVHKKIYNYMLFSRRVDLYVFVYLEIEFFVLYKFI